MPLDFEDLRAKAWHIYSTEVCEEGLRYIDEPDAGKLVQRSFRMAEIFLRYEQRLSMEQSAAPSRQRRQESEQRPERTPRSSAPISEVPPASEEASAPEDEDEGKTQEAPVASNSRPSESSEAPQDHQAGASDDEPIEPRTIQVD